MRSIDEAKRNLDGGSIAAGGEPYSASFSSSQPQKKKSDFAFS